MADFFDVNAVGSDSHLQFTNWTIDNNGAYDYAADTRGYTYAAIVEYDAPRWSLRFGEALMPTVANGIDMDWNIARARAENLELELRPAERPDGESCSATPITPTWAATMRPSRAFCPVDDPRPDIVAHRAQGRVKTGVGLNAEYAFPAARARVRANRMERRAQRVVCVHRGEQQRAGRRRSDRRRCGAARTIGWASRSCRTVCRRRTASISRWAARASCSATGRSVTAARTSSRPTTPRISGAACRRRAVCSTSTIRATTGTADRSSWRCSGCTSTSERLENGVSDGQEVPQARLVRPPVRVARRSVGQAARAFLSRPLLCSGLRRPLIRTESAWSADVMDFWETIDRRGDTLQTRLDLQCQELRIVPRLMQIAAVEPQAPPAASASTCCAARLPTDPDPSWCRSPGPSTLPTLSATSREIRSAAQPFIEP